MAHRYLIAPPQGDTLQLTGEAAHHLARVLRVRPGEELVLFDGAGTDYDAVVTAAQGDTLTLQITARRPSAGEAPVAVSCYISVSRGERMDWAVQKCVELGAVHIQPVFSANCVVKPKNEAARAERLGRIAQQAAEQCGRGIVPGVAPAVDFDKALGDAAARCERVLILHEKGGVPLREAMGEADSLALFTGPEGGYSEQEITDAAGVGAVTTYLGPRILRCETAPLAALAAILALRGGLE